MCAAVGKKDAALGEIPIAFVQLQEGDEISPDALMEFVNRQVAPYKKLREIRIIKRFPLLATGKLNRRKLIGMIQQEG
jgi:acyl-coenzyme A synthetase/AMP-(fatty) acid ligase